MPFSREAWPHSAEQMEACAITLRILETSELFKMEACAITTKQQQTNKADCCQFFYCTNDTLEHTRGYMEATQDTHTQAWGRREFVLCFFPIPGRPSSRTPQEQWAASQRPGTKWTVRLGQGRTGLFCSHVFLLGFLAEETPCEHGENMQTPHRKAREIAHLSTVHSGFIIHAISSK